MICLIDGDFIPYFVCHNKKGAEPKTLGQVLMSCDAIIMETLQSLGCDNYIGYVSNGKPTFRHEISSKYKQNRKQPKPPFFRECMKHLIDVWKFIPADESLEADDMVSIARNIIGINSCVVVSHDQDLLHQEGINYNVRKKVLLRVSAKESLYHFYLDMLKGQKGDGIEGLKGVGPKTAEKYLSCFKPEEYHEACFKMYQQYYKDEEKASEEFAVSLTTLSTLKEKEGFTLPTAHTLNLDYITNCQFSYGERVETRTSE
jgi:hypothetical protein